MDELFQAIEELSPAIITIAIFVFLYLAFERGRSRKLNEFARGSLFHFSRKGDSDEMKDKLPPTFLLEKEAYNVMTGVVEGVKVTIFDFHETHGQNNFRSPLDQTQLFLESEDLHFPDFTLQPKKTMHRIGGLVGYQDIPFAGSEDLSRRYLLRGKEVALIQSLFGSPILSFLEENPQVVLEGKGKRLKFFKNPGSLIPPSRVPVSRMRHFLDEGLFLLRCFQEAAPPSLNQP